MSAPITNNILKYCMSTLPSFFILSEVCLGIPLLKFCALKGATAMNVYIVRNYFKNGFKHIFLSKEN